MTALRQKMIKTMDLKDLSENTQRGYLQAVTSLAKHYRIPPDQLSQEMIDDYLLYLKNDLKRAPKTCGVARSAFYFFIMMFLKMIKYLSNFPSNELTEHSPLF